SLYNERALSDRCNTGHRLAESGVSALRPTYVGSSDFRMCWCLCDATLANAGPIGLRGWRLSTRLDACDGYFRRFSWAFRQSNLLDAMGRVRSNWRSIGSSDGLDFHDLQMKEGAMTRARWHLWSACCSSRSK